MAIKIPEEPKVYTTVYDNFKGVDFTNDPSNVWRRRSPSGLNMLPDLDGRPYKRKGWKIVIPKNDFVDISDVTGVGFEPYRTYYFELGGVDYLMLFNSYGVFSYDGDTLRYIDEYIDTDNHVQRFPPNQDRLLKDSKRCFFYEGNGVAGFYMWSGMTLFCFEADGIVREVAPYVPHVLMGCDPANGAGEDYYQLNILTRERTVSFTKQGSGKETAEYHLLEKISPTSTPIVKVFDDTLGEATEAKAQEIGWSIMSDFSGITFNSNITTGVSGEDNVFITYEGAVNNQLSAKILGEKEFSLQKNDDGSWGQIASTSSSASSGYFVLMGESINYSDIRVVVSLAGIDNTDWITLYVYDPSRNEYVDVEEYLIDGEPLALNEIFDIYMSAYADTATYSSVRDMLWNSTVPYISSARTKKKTSDTVENATIRKYKFKWQFNPPSADAEYSVEQSAFIDCTRYAVFGTGLTNQIFVCGNNTAGFKSRLWYSQVGQPNYFPQRNYTEVGSNDTSIMGLLKCGEYLGVIKQGKTTDTSIYLAYPTSFEDDTTYAVKQSIAGIGAISFGAFNVLNEEPLFLSEDGVMGIEIGEENRVRSRSYFVNGLLRKEKNLSTAVSFVFDSQYWLCVNNHCYVLDGSQKTSWANERTNLQYECYFLDNIPAQCFARMDGELYFVDTRGNLCRFVNSTDEHQYVDSYCAEALPYTTVVEPVDGKIDTKTLIGDFRVALEIADNTENSIIDDEDRNLIFALSEPAVNDSFTYDGTDYTILSIDENGIADVIEGVPIKAVWSTIADDDGAVHYFKNLQKKGCVVSLLPSADSGVDVYVKADEGERILVGNVDTGQSSLPYDFYVKKKIKKYKRLQFICENGTYDDSFGLDQIIKSYTIGNYSKRR